MVRECEGCWLLTAGLTGARLSASRSMTHGVGQADALSSLRVTPQRYGVTKEHGGRTERVGDDAQAQVQR